MTRQSDRAPGALAAVFAGNGEMAQRIRDFDWAATPLGPVESWDPTLCHAVAALLASKAQIILLWGDDYITFYNDAYRPVFGAKHPKVLGAPTTRPVVSVTMQYTPRTRPDSSRTGSYDTSK